MLFDNLFDAAAQYLPMLEKFTGSIEDTSFEVTLTGDCSGVFSGRLSSGRILLEKCPMPDSEFGIVADSGDFLRLLEGRLNVPVSLATGRVKIRGNIAKLLRIIDEAKRSGGRT